MKNGSSERSPVVSTHKGQHREVLSRGDGYSIVGLDFCMPREGSPGLPGNSRQGDLVRSGPVGQFCCLRNWWEQDSGRWRFGVDGESRLPVRPVAGEGYLGRSDAS